jgi:hypothetical protein
MTSHYGDGVDLPAVTSGYPPASPGKERTKEEETGEVDIQLLKCAPYADRVLAMVKLEQHQSSQTAPEDLEEIPPRLVRFTCSLLLRKNH